MARSESHPEITVLADEQKARVLERLGRRRPRCGWCGSSEFRIGDALYLGFLFIGEATDTYMVALTCTNPACQQPLTGISLRADEFLLQ